MVRWSDLHSCRKVKDDAIVVGRTCSSPSRFDGLADLDGEVRFRLGEGLGTVLVSELGPKFSGALVGQLADEFRVLDGQFDGLLFRIPEHDLTERRTSGVVHVQDGFLGPGHRFDGPPD